VNAGKLRKLADGEPRWVDTDYELSVQDAIDQGLANIGTSLPRIGVVYGEAGVGKTETVKSVLSGFDVETLKFEFPPRTTMKEIARTLYGEVSGEDNNHNRYTLTHMLIPLLEERPRLFVIDETQRLSHECVEHLRFIHDLERSQVAYLFVGGNGCWELIRRFPMLQSRVIRAVEITPLRNDDLLDMIPRYHPIYEHLDHELIIDINDRFARGIFRNWAVFTATARTVLRRAPEPALNKRFVDDVLALVGKAGRRAA
jgi:hypothetical protein